MVTRWPEATAMRFSSDQATALGCDGAATRAAAWKRDAIEFAKWPLGIWELEGKSFVTRKKKKN